MLIGMVACAAFGIWFAWWSGVGEAKFAIGAVAVTAGTNLHITASVTNCGCPVILEGIRCEWRDGLDRKQVLDAFSMWNRNLARLSSETTTLLIPGDAQRMRILVTYSALPSWWQRTCSSLSSQPALSGFKPLKNWAQQDSKELHQVFSNGWVTNRVGTVSSK